MINLNDDFDDSINNTNDKFKKKMWALSVKFFRIHEFWESINPKLSRLSYELADMSNIIGSQLSVDDFCEKFFMEFLFKLEELHNAIKKYITADDFMDCNPIEKILELEIRDSNFRKAYKLGCEAELKYYEIIS